MAREVTIEIRQTPGPTLGDRLLGTSWSWTVISEDRAPETYVVQIRRSGRAYTEKGARRKAERTARHIIDLKAVEYKYNPEGLL